MSDLQTAVRTTTAPATSQSQSVGAARTSGPAKVVSYVLLGVVILIFLFPLAFLVNTALKSNSEFFNNPTGIAKAPLLSNFGKAWHQCNFAAYVLNSVLYTLAAEALGLTACASPKPTDSLRAM